MLHKNGDKHCVDADILANAKFKQAWILTDPGRFDVPVKYKHPRELRKSSMSKGWQRTCCRQLRCDFLTSDWSMLPRLQLPALPPQAMAAASSQAVLPSTSAICPPPRPLPTPHRLASRITFLAGSNSSPSLQFPRVPSHSAEALCEALRSQGLCLTHAETASLLAAPAKRSFRASPPCDYNFTNAVSSMWKSVAAGKGCISQKPQRACTSTSGAGLCVSATHVSLRGAVRARAAASCTGVDSCSVLLMACLLAHVRWRVMMGSSTPTSGLQTIPLQCLSPGYAGGGINYFHRASFQGEAMLLRATDANVAIKVRTLRQCGFIRRSLLYNGLRVPACLLGSQLPSLS